MGGAWHYNTYPGCRCDVPSHLYSFSFAPNPNWSETYSPQPEIREYLRRCADEFGIRPHMLTDTEVESAAWDEGEQRWRAADQRRTRSPRSARQRHGPADRAQASRRAGHRALRGQDHALRPLGPRPRPHRPARGVDRNRSVGDPVRARDPGPGRHALRLPAHRALDHAPQRAPDQPPRAHAVPLCAGRAAAGAGRRSTAARSCSCSASSSTRV